MHRGHWLPGRVTDIVASRSARWSLGAFDRAKLVHLASLHCSLWIQTLANFKPWTMINESIELLERMRQMGRKTLIQIINVK